MDVMILKMQVLLFPLIGAGMGGSRVKVRTITVPGYGSIDSCVDDNVFAYQLSAGVA